jgi:hypothetical protein
MTHTQMIIAAVISNAIAFILLLLSWKRKNTARILYAILFIWASITNWITAHTNPSVYIEYGQLALEPYRKFIYGEFSDHITGYVSLIAFGQMAIALCKLSKGLVVKLGCIGGIMFLLCIAPLGLGAAFPFSLIAGSGLFILFRYNFRSDILRDKWLA